MPDNHFVILARADDAKYFATCPMTKRQGNSITIGTAGHINGAYLEVDVPNAVFFPHILVGRFSSLSWDLKFNLGNNHKYRDTVSTFPFYVRGTLNDLVAQVESGESIPVTPSGKEKMYLDNHYQIVIGSDVWIARGTTILGGVKIGSGAIIGANANVTKDIPPYAIAVGNPVRIIKYRFDEETIKKFMAIKWWNWDLRKILENAPLMDNPKEFLEKHYSPELEKIPEENIQGGGLGFYQNIFLKVAKFILLLQIFMFLNLCGKELSAAFVNRLQKIRF